MCQRSEEVFLKKLFKNILAGATEIYDRCYPKGCAAPGEVQCQCNTQGTLSKLKRTPSQAKINVTSKSPVGDISVVTLIRTDTTLDHSQKAEKVWACILGGPPSVRPAHDHAASKGGGCAPQVGSREPLKHARSRGSDAVGLLPA